jgi:ketosteroid isomerase-like protein
MGRDLQPQTVRSLGYPTWEGRQQRLGGCAAVAKGWQQWCIAVVSTGNKCHSEKKKISAGGKCYVTGKCRLMCTNDHAVYGRTKKIYYEYNHWDSM